MEWSAGTCMEIAKDNKPSSGKAYMHNYKFDSKGATNKNLEKRSHRDFGSGENYS